MTRPRQRSPLFPYTTLFRSNDCLVANGYMVCGDAAWFPNPISAGGIGPGLIGGVMAGERSEEHTSELQSPYEVVWRLLLELKRRSRLLLALAHHDHLVERGR